MRCPYCQSDVSRVLDSRSTEHGIRRRRECAACGGRFTTYERVETASVLVRKRDGRREPFDRQKLLAGVARACEKRPLGSNALEVLVDAVASKVLSRAANEVTSTWIGELVMDQLKRLDGIAYVRFASVYRPFADLNALRDVLADLDRVVEGSGPISQVNPVSAGQSVLIGAGPPEARMPATDD